MKKYLSTNNSIKTFLILGLFAILAFQLLDLNKFFLYSDWGSTVTLRIQDFITLFLSIIIESFPFIILGVLISTLIGINTLSTLKRIIFKYKLVFFPIYYLIIFFIKFDSKLIKNRIYSHVKVSLIGVFLPVCECGNIPLARRLLLSKFSVSQSITFLLAAPILNPITFLTTMEAFSFDPSIAFIRIGAAFFIANFIGILISYKKPQNDLLNKDFYQEVCNVDNNIHNKNKFVEAINIFNTEFWGIFRMLMIGAILASASQSFVPRDVITSIGQNPILSVFAMIFLAFVISICSNVDAFFALSYANSFTTGSILGFLIFGPMIDIKILTMLKATFKIKFLLIVSTVVMLLSLITAFSVNVLK